MESSDQQLVDRCRGGDAQAWESLVRFHGRRVLNMAYQYTGRFDLAEELTQEVFLKIYQNLHSFRAEAGSFTNWLMRVCRNLLVDHYRSQKHDRKLGGSDELETHEYKLESFTPDAFDALHAKERALLLERGLSLLSGELKEAVILRDIQDCTYKEISAILEIPVGTVKSRINRGRIELARVIRKLKLVVG